MKAGRGFTRTASRSSSRTLGHCGLPAGMSGHCGPSDTRSAVQAATVVAIPSPNIAAVQSFQRVTNSLLRGRVKFEANCFQFVARRAVRIGAPRITINETRKRHVARLQFVRRVVCKAPSSGAFHEASERQTPRSSDRAGDDGLRILDENLRRPRSARAARPALPARPSRPAAATTRPPQSPCP